jgi:tRNA_anti-like
MRSPASGPRVCILVGVLSLLGGLAAVACVDRLPSQDRRILDARPVAKLSADDLARDYQRDARAADAQYWGKAVEISGTVAGTHDEATGAILVFNDKDGKAIVEAGLLEDQAKAILASTSDSRRVTLRCYCAGLDGRVQLLSCIVP